MDRVGDFITENKQPVLIGIVILIIIIFGGVLMAQPKEKSAPIKKIESPVTENGSLQIKTFPVDELNQPINEQNATEAIERNEARIDAMAEQMEQDLQTLEELEKMF